MLERSKSGYAIDVQDAFARFTLDSATEFLFGRCVHSLHSGLLYPPNAPQSTATSYAVESTAEKFGRAFTEAEIVLAKRSAFANLWPLAEMTKDATEEPMKVVRTFIEPILADALARYKERTSSPRGSRGQGDKVADEETLLDYLVKHTQGDTYSTHRSAVTHT